MSPLIRRYGNKIVCVIEEIPRHGTPLKWLRSRDEESLHHTNFHHGHATEYNARGVLDYLVNRSFRFIASMHAVSIMIK